MHPSDNPRVIAGQGTCSVEILDEAPGLDLFVTPVGGEGLLSGTALAVRSPSSHARLVGAEPVAADDARRSLLSGTLFPSGNPRTIADGLRTSLGPTTLPPVRGLRVAVILSGGNVILSRLPWALTA